MSFMIFQNKTTPFQAIKTRSSKSRKIDIFPNGLTNGFGRKMAIFPTFIFRQYRPEKCLLRYSRRRKTPFSAIKTRSSKSRKIDIFPKRLTHVFGIKMAILPTFFQAIYGRKMSFMIFENEKTPFYAIKARSSKGRKIDIFNQGFCPKMAIFTHGFCPKMAIFTHGFCPKMAIFATFFFRQYRPGKWLLRNSRTKKLLSRL